MQKSRDAKKTPYLFTVILLLILIVVGYFVFQEWRGRTDIVSGNITITPAANVNTNTAPVKRTPLESGEPNTITINDRDIQAPVVYVDEASEEVFQDALTGGVVHYPGTAKPGELGNPYIFGHSSDYFWKPGDYKAVFAPLVDIPVDTEVRITNDNGELFIYRVIETKIVGPRDVSVLDQQNYERYLLTLQTSYPIGTALKRFIVVCELDAVATFGPTE